MTFRRAFVLLALLAVPAAAQTPEKSVVKVVVAQEGEEPRIAAGFVTDKGFVVTTFHCLDRATAVEVITADGAKNTATGVASYQTDANLSLLAVDWKGQAPAGLTLAAEPPEADATISMLHPSETAPEVSVVDEDATDRISGSYQWTFRAAGELGLTSGGAPIVKDGAVVGVVAGVHRAIPALMLDTPVKKTAKRVYDAARPELIRTLKPGAVVPWSGWKSKQADIEKAVELFRKADAAHRKGDTETGVELARETVKLDERNWRAWRMLCHAQAPDDEKCLEAADHAIALLPTDSYAYTVKACALARQMDTDDAIAAAKMAVKLEPKYYMTHHTLAYCLQYASDLEGAIKAYEQALKLNPRDDRAREELARIREHLGDVKAASPEPRF